MKAANVLRRQGRPYAGETPPRQQLLVDRIPARQKIDGHPTDNMCPDESAGYDRQRPAKRESGARMRGLTKGSQPIGSWS